MLQLISSIAQLEHLKEHNESDNLKEVLVFLNEKGIQVDFKENTSGEQLLHSGCPGACMMMFDSPVPQAAGND